MASEKSKINTDRFKHIQKTYLAADGKLHQSAHKIAYRTGRVVYYPKHGQDELEAIPMHAIYETLPAAIVHQMFSTEDRSSFVYHWKPASRGQLNSLEIKFRQASLLAGIERMETELERIARERARVERMAVNANGKLAAFQESLARELPRWKATYEAEAERINSMIAAGQEVASPFIRPDTPDCGVPESLNHDTAWILAARVTTDPDKAGMSCDVSFDRTGPGRIFTVPSTTLPGLCEYLVPDETE